MSGDTTDQVERSKVFVQINSWMIHGVRPLRVLRLVTSFYTRKGSVAHGTVSFPSVICLVILHNTLFKILP